MGETDRVVIVGGGISGLTTATSLARRGVKVLLIEKNDVCGGLVNSFRRDGFLFDGGVRALENAGMVKKMPFQGGYQSSCRYGSPPRISWPCRQIFAPLF